MSSGLQGLPKAAWEWVLFLGAVCAIVFGLFLFLEDTSGFPASVARDVKIVSVTLILGGAVAHVLATRAMQLASLRWGLIAVVTVVALITLSGMLLQVARPIVMLPPVLLVFGTLMLFQHLRKARIAEEKSKNEKAAK